MIIIVATTYWAPSIWQALSWAFTHEFQWIPKDTWALSLATFCWWGNWGSKKLHIFTQVNPAGGSSLICLRPILVSTHPWRDYFHVFKVHFSWNVTMCKLLFCDDGKVRCDSHIKWTINHLKVNNSRALSTFALLCKIYLIADVFITPKAKPYPSPVALGRCLIPTLSNH